MSRWAEESAERSRGRLSGARLVRTSWYRQSGSTPDARGSLGGVDGGRSVTTRRRAGHHREAVAQDRHPLLR